MSLLDWLILSISITIVFIISLLLLIANIIIDVEKKMNNEHHQ